MGRQRKGLASPATRFAARVDRREPHECWPALHKDGRPYSTYALFYHDGAYELAHRFAFRNAGGELRADQLVCHSCDNPPCCNPAHLFAGSDADNVHDMHAKGRAFRPAGELHGRAKLTRKAVDAIRSAPRGASRVALALQHGVSRFTINKIRDRERWT